MHLTHRQLQGEFPMLRVQGAFPSSWCLFRAPGGQQSCWASPALPCAAKGRAVRGGLTMLLFADKVRSSQMGFWKRQGDCDRHLLGVAAKPYFCTGDTLLRTRWVSFPGSWQLPGTWLCSQQLVAMTNSLWAPNKTSHLLYQHYRGIHSECTFPVHRSCPPF